MLNESVHRLDKNIQTMIVLNFLYWNMKHKMSESKIRQQTFFWLSNNF